jgi:hypothetical protein
MGAYVYMTGVLIAAKYLFYDQAPGQPLCDMHCLLNK